MKLCRNPLSHARVFTERNTGRKSFDPKTKIAQGSEKRRGKNTHGELKVGCLGNQRLPGPQGLRCAQALRCPDKIETFAAGFRLLTKRNYFVTLHSGKASRSFAIASSETLVARKLTALSDFI